MKKVTLLIAMVVGVAYASHAQQKDNVIKADLLSPIFGTFNFGYERTLSDVAGVQLSISITSVTVVSTKFSGFAITPEYRIYLSESAAPEGIYVAPFIGFRSYTLSIIGYESTLTGFSLGGVLGKQWLLGRKQNISIDSFIGPRYSITSLKEKGDEALFSLGAFKGFGLSIGATIGYAF